MSKYVKRAIIAIIVAAAALYLGDSMLIRYKMAYRGADSALGTVQYMMGAELKNGKVEYFDVPQTKTCAHSLLPQFGYAPCWYARRTTEQVVGPNPQPLFLPDMRKKY